MLAEVPFAEVALAGAGGGGGDAAAAGVDAAAELATKAALLPMKSIHCPRLHYFILSQSF